MTGEVAFGPFTILALALLAGLLFLLFRPMPKRDEVVVGKVLEGEAA